GAVAIAEFQEAVLAELGGIRAAEPNTVREEVDLSLYEGRFERACFAISTRAVDGQLEVTSVVTDPVLVAYEGGSGSMRSTVRLNPVNRGTFSLPEVPGVPAALLEQHFVEFDSEG